METIFLHAIVGGSLVSITAIFYIFRPANINSWYGYRTPRSMRSLQAWNVAQKIGSRGLLLASMGNVLIHLASWWLVPDAESVLIPLATFLIGVIITVVLTERALKRQFPD